jgi:hypothetical protein
MSWSDHKAFAQDWVESWNTHDIDRIMSHYADNVRLTSPKVREITGREDGTIRGKGNLHEYFKVRLAGQPNLHFDLARVYSGVLSLVLEFHTSDGRHVAEFMHFDPAGLVTRVFANSIDTLEKS